MQSVPLSVLINVLNYLTLEFFLKMSYLSTHLSLKKKPKLIYKVVIVHLVTVYHL